jgi:hypothetical protein
MLDTSMLACTPQSLSMFMAMMLPTTGNVYFKLARNPTNSFTLA